MNEIWKPVVGWEHAYEVSNLGRVRSIDRYVNAGYGRKRLMKGRILRQHIQKGSASMQQYQQVITVPMRKNGKASAYTVHRLVAMAFIPNPENKKTVNHIDGNRHNNKLDNLEWATNSENIKHSYDKLVHKPGGRRKLSETDIDNIKKLRKQGLTLKELSGKFSICISQISKICSGTGWKHLTKKDS